MMFKMAEEESIEKVEEEEKLSTMDMLSQRLVELKNSEREYMARVATYEQRLQQAQADVIACRARIDEVTQLINRQSKPDPAKP